jgi:hypothetical protein
LSLQILSLWFVCGLGTAILIAAVPVSRAAVAAAVGAFALGAWWVQQPFGPTPAAVALSTGLMAVWQLVRAPRLPFAAMMAGLLAGFWTAVLNQQGLPLVIAIPAAALVPVVAG